jgi:hypothetical protein
MNDRKHVKEYIENRGGFSFQIAVRHDCLAEYSVSKGGDVRD